MKVTKAVGFAARRRGLAGVDRPSDQPALLFERCRSVHTFGMRFRLDLLWLDRQQRVIRVDYGVPARRIHSCLRARSVIEVAAGGAQKLLQSGYTAAR